MTEPSTVARSDLLTLTGEIVAAHVGNNATSTDELPALIQAVFEKLNALSNDEPATEELVPAVPIRRSVTDDYIVCLEDGKKLKTLKRHLMTAYGMRPEEYRKRWGLKPDYPMVAPAYARTRQELAKKIGLGRRPAPVPELAPKRRGRRKTAG